MDSLDTVVSHAPMDVLVSPESRVEILRRVATEWTEVCEKRLDERFEHPMDSREKLDFHDRKHTREVKSRMGRVMDILAEHNPELGINEESRLIGGMKADAHDLVQRGEVKNGVRTRYSPGNEIDSGAELMMYMKEVNAREQSEVFTTNDQKGAMDVQVTAVKYDPDLKTVYQPDLTAQSSVDAKALAIADLGEPGWDPQAFIKNGNALFREINVELSEKMTQGTATDADQLAYANTMKGWFRSQVPYITGRWERLQKIEAMVLPEPSRTRLLDEVRPGFEESIRLAEERAERVASMEFGELAQEMGYGTIGTS